ncbi:MAG: Hsp20/alpha crystallin family protein [Candidatus Methanoliparum thermophilum]|uniref:Hsp20/alpha crystallin family protein n=1 Tax=Methanoliparum thermophilum TaxID=2491083 RepID=A0A520KTF5_METT2|nr:Hsp20/alpha crystallin family protein [Candidatus Methanoliparum sp. LAM-1]RZN65262.1 MAG: Hsp20/alpha crystallin family protein [Candidatus Methanoliparum thermophilum]BDC36561.1 heat-shock protein [Candidatus Methanoliparum sp. LAM-1]
MAIRRWGIGLPDEIKRIRDEMDRIFEDFLQPFSSTLTPSITEAAMPLMDVIDAGDKFIIKADIPGVDKEDVSVSLEGDTLEIKAEKKEEKEEDKAGFLRRERVFKSYYRSLILPESVDAEKVNAIFNNGVLNIELPKKEKKEGKKIEIK